MMEKVNKAKREIEKLRRKIRHHDHRYYTLDQPEISDSEYDGLMRRLKTLEEKYPQLKTIDSPTQRVGGELLEGFRQVKHHIPMLSLDNAYSIEELKDWDKRVHKGLGKEKVEYVAELKIDGTSASFIYKDGKFSLGVSRGNGEIGEDTSSNLRTIRSMPLRLLTKKGYQLPHILEVRGEVYMNYKNFEELNKHRKQRGESIFANPRNAAAGSLKLLDSRISAERHLNFFVHSFGSIKKGKEFSSQWEFLDMMKECGLRINPNIKL